MQKMQHICGLINEEDDLSNDNFITNNINEIIVYWRNFHFKENFVLTRNILNLCYKWKESNIIFKKLLSSLVLEISLNSLIENDESVLDTILICDNPLLLELLVLYDITNEDSKITKYGRKFLIQRKECTKGWCRGYGRNGFSKFFKFKIIS